MKKILVPVDFSANCLNSVLYAAHLAQRGRGEVILLHAYHIPVHLPDLPISLMEERRLEAHKKMKKLVEQVQSKGNWKEGEGPELGPMIREGLAVDLIVEISLEEGVQLIVMGTSGAKGLEELLFGTHTTTVIQRCKCPVLTVPEEAVFNGLEKIVFATDWMASNTLVFDQLVDVARALDAEIDVVHILEPDEKYHLEEIQKQEEKLLAKLNYAKVGFHMLEADNVIEGLEDYIEASGAKLVAMFTHKRNFLSALFIPSLTRSMAMHTHVPLLAIHG